MLKIKHVLFALVLVLFSVSLVFARPPSAIELNYDSALEELGIDISHVSKNPRKHFIREVLVYLNDEEIQTLRFVTQTSGTGTAAEVKLSASPGDTIRVEAICNEAGRKEASITVPAPEEGSTEK